jgi:hypothetical protein
VLACFHESFRALNGELRDTRVTFDVGIIGARHQLGRRMRTTEISDFFRAFIDKEDDQLDLRMILGDGVGDMMKQRRLAGARRGDNQTALTHAQRRHQIHDPRRVTVGHCFQLDPLVRINRR